MPGLVLVERNDGVAVVQLNRPDDLNALSPQTVKRAVLAPEEGSIGLGTLAERNLIGAVLRGRGPRRGHGRIPGTTSGRVDRAMTTRRTSLT